MPEAAGQDQHHVVVATDESFAMPTAVALRSLARASEGPICVTVLHDSISPAAMDRISRSLPHEDVELRWSDVGHLDAGATRRSHLGVATYFRLWVERVVPPEATRVLYLDVDTIVRRDLAPLFATDLAGHVLAAVRSVHFPFVGSRGAVNHWRQLGLDPRAPFFNAGVLLIDVARWRSEGVEARALEYLQGPHLGGGADQEALNVALTDRWLAIPPIWNQQTPILTDDHGAHLIHTADEIAAARSDPAIVHFQTRPKPWHRGSSHPWAAEWLDHAAGVAFDRVTGLRERPLADEARWRAKRAASALLRGR